MGLKDKLGEYFSYPKLLYKVFKANKGVEPEKYSFGSDKRQYILAFTPKEIIKEDVIVYIHGGGWKHGSPREFRYIGKKLAGMGFHTALLGYRHAPRHKNPCQIRDVFCGFEKYMDILKNNGVSPRNVIVIGSSAGGHLGAGLVYDKNLQKEYGLDQKIFKGFVSLGGPLVFDVCKNRAICSLINGFCRDNDDKKQADPYYMLKGDEKVRVLCMHSYRDPVCEKENSIAFTEKVNSLSNGLATCYIENDKRFFHSNLVAGIFIGDNPQLCYLNNWIESLNV